MVLKCNDPQIDGLKYCPPLPPPPKQITTFSLKKVRIHTERNNCNTHTLAGKHRENSHFEKWSFNRSEAQALFKKKSYLIYFERRQKLGVEDSCWKFQILLLGFPPSPL